jgi:hypothetical protein
MRRRQFRHDEHRRQFAPVNSRVARRNGQWRAIGQRCRACQFARRDRAAIDDS